MPEAGSLLTKRGSGLLRGGGGKGGLTPPIIAWECSISVVLPFADAAVNTGDSISSPFSSGKGESCFRSLEMVVSTERSIVVRCARGI